MPRDRRLRGVSWPLRGARSWLQSSGVTCFGMRSNRLYGARRVAWRVRRSVPRIARPLSRVLPPADPPRNPIFVIGCPRSGTTLLLDSLRASGELATVQNEGHVLWDEFHHPRDHGWGSDA